MILSRHMIRILALPQTRQLDIKALNDFARYYVSSSLTEQIQPVIQEFNKLYITLGAQHFFTIQ